ncbi:hypothetical protein B0H66DRAFT_558701 [Apodospora peruviana]|uniref:Uncharacterized protein n=1 Tax=Apodospora peruviana TaxID=516989 RepID=A0AAE0M4V6_9PEZI|nr:hypothetical protein B0H66DRAFT_558701 [Apodospora peruviana]
MHEMRARIATFLDRLHNSDHRFAATPDAETVNNIFGKSGVLHLIEPINIDTFLGQAIEVLYMATDLDTMFRRSLPDWRLEPDTSLNITGLLGFEFKSEKMEEVGRRDVPNPEDSPNYLHVTGTLVVVPRLVRFGNNEGRGYDQEVQIEKAEVVVDGLLE